MKIKVNYFFRKKLPEFNSIEELFRNIILELKNEISVEIFEVPNSGANFRDIILNLFYVIKYRSSIVHITGHINYISIVSGRNSILTIHDIGFVFNRSKFQEFIIKVFWIWFPILFVKKVTVVSEFSKQELIKIIPFGNNKICVIPNSVNKRFIFNFKSFNNKCPLILHLGTKDNKNLDRTIKALQDINCRLLIIGKLTAKHLDLLSKSKIQYINKFDVSFDEIIQSYIDCDIVSFVSTYEGFGVPIIEAQATGRPVITSTICSMPDVAGIGACLVDPYNVDAIRAGIEKIISDEVYRVKLISSGLKNVTRFNVDSIAKQYLELYREIANC